MVVDICCPSPALSLSPSSPPSPVSLPASSLYDDVIQYNNQGATYLENGNLSQGVELLSKALTECKKRMTESPHSNVTSVEQCLEGRVLVEDWMSSSYNVSATTFTTSIPGRNIYRPPIHVPVLTSQQVYQRYHGHFLSIAIIFNLALAHQLRADSLMLLVSSMSNRKSHTACLTKSIKIYQLALRLMSQLDGNDDSTSPDLFILATFNNLANVHYALGEWDETKTYYNQMRTTLYHPNNETTAATAATNNITRFFVESSFDPIFMGRHEGCPAAAA